jgi:hypothetical protein
MIERAGIDRSVALGLPIPCFCGNRRAALDPGRSTGHLTDDSR